MINLQEAYQKNANSTLNHEEWNTLMGLLQSAVDLNNGENTFTHITSKGNLEIETKNKTNPIKEATSEVGENGFVYNEECPSEPSAEDIDYNKYYPETEGYSHIIASESPNINIETDSSINLSSLSQCVWDDIEVTAENFDDYHTNGDFGTGLKSDTDPEIKYVDGLIYGIDTLGTRKKSDIQGGGTLTTYDENLRYVKCRQLSASKGIGLESDSKIKISSPKTTIEGVTGFGSTISFGETDEGIRYQYKATKKGKNKQCDVIQVEVLNNSSEAITFNHSSHVASNSDKFGQEANQIIPTFYNAEGVQVPAKSSVVIAQASILDIIKFINWAKNIQFFGPWSQQQNN